MLRIGVNALYLIPGEVGGTEIYLRNILRALAAIDAQNEYFIFRNSETGPDLVPAQANFNDCPQPVNARFRPARILFEQTRFPWRVSRLRLDVLFNAGFTAPVLYPGPMVTVFHDLQYKRHPEFFRAWDLPFWKILLPASAARSRYIVVPSTDVKSDIEESYRFAPSRVVHIPHGVEPEFFEIAKCRRLTPPSESILLCVSTLHPHKNLETMLQAFSQFRKANPEWKLYIAGLKGFDAGRIEDLRRQLDLENDLVITGWIAREALYDLFTRAQALIYPSRFEGFGMPVAEAMAAGLPVVCSNIPPLIEIAGDAARFFDPNNPNDLVDALHEITTNAQLRETLIQCGRARAESFDWKAAAHRLLALFQHL